MNIRKTVRLKNHKTQTEISRSLGVTLGTISNFERFSHDSRSPDVVIYYALMARASGDLEEYVKSGIEYQFKGR